MKLDFEAASVLRRGRGLYQLMLTRFVKAAKNVKISDGIALDSAVIFVYCFHDNVTGT
jgi:hypothetical protein